MYRNGWLYSIGTGGSTAAEYSTAKLNHLRPFEYFEHLLMEIPRHMDNKDLDFVEDMLPWSPALPESYRNNPAKE
jgi:hypothetical protein